MTGASLTFGSGAITLDRDRLTTFRENLELDHAEFIADELGRRGGFRERLAADYGEAFTLMNALHAMSLEAMDWARQEVPTHLLDDDDQADWDKYLHLMHGLCARALLVFDETAWLLQGGYPWGALTRVRTLHELYVAGAVITQYGHPGSDHPQLVDRYLLHRDVFTRSTADDLMDTGVLDSKQYFTKEMLDTLTRSRRSLLDHFGAKFKLAWGWAAPVMPAGKDPSMGELGRLVAPELRFLYGVTSAHVHAGSQGWHENVVKREHEDRRAAGPMNVGLGLPAIVGSHFLLAMAEMVVPARIEPEDGDSIDTGAYFLSALSDVIERLSAAFSDGESRVDLREKEFQRSLRHPARATDGEPI